jgi:hypothetical protein
MAIGDPYNSLAEFKGVLGITSNEEDDWITTCLNGARRAIETRSGWPTFWNTVTPVTRTVETVGKVVPVRRAGYSYCKLLLRDGIASATGFSVAGYGSASLIDIDRLAEGKPIDSIKIPAYYAPNAGGTLDIQAIWGWPLVQPDIKWAHQMQSHRYYRRKGSPEGIAGSAEWGLSRVPRLDPDVLGILKDGGYMRAGIG